MVHKSFFLNLDRGIINKAVTTASQLVEYMLANGLAKGTDLHVVVLDPAFSFSNQTPGVFPKEAILWEKSFGNPDAWEHDLKFYAYAKALTAVRHQTSTSKLKDTDHALTLMFGDALMIGGVYENGLAVGVSGVEGCLDESVAWCFLKLIIGFVNQAKDKYMETHRVIGYDEK